MFVKLKLSYQAATYLEKVREFGLVSNTEALVYGCDSLNQDYINSFRKSLNVADVHFNVNLLHFRL